MDRATLERHLRATDDAQEWARQFMAFWGDRRAEIDEALMTGWFANAMETGREHKQTEGEDR